MLLNNMPFLIRMADGVAVWRRVPYSITVIITSQNDHTRQDENYREKGIKGNA